MHPDLQRTQIKLGKALRGFHQTNPYSFVDALDAPEASIVLQMQQAGHETPLLASDVISIIYGDGHRYANFRVGELLMLARLASLDDAARLARQIGGLDDIGDPAARIDDMDTSHAAAEGLSPLKMSELRKTILRTLYIEGEDGLTDIDLVRMCDGDQRRSTIRTRRSELVTHGFIRDSGERRHQEGSMRAVWVLTDKGRAEAEALMAGTP
jgi:hypothetical protein